MDEDANINDRVSQEFEEGFEAWCDMKGNFTCPYEENSFEWIEWNQGWNEAAGNFDQKS